MPWGRHEREETRRLASLITRIFPPFRALLACDPDAFRLLTAHGWRQKRSRKRYLQLFLAAIEDFTDDDQVRQALRRIVGREKLRIAVRELLPPAASGADVDVTAREVADLAATSLDIALLAAEQSAFRRFGWARDSEGNRARLTVLGMGKLGGRELNVGSDIDLIFVYDTDDGTTGSGATLHEYWSYVAQKLVATLEDATEQGAAWRVDLRLRPEGSRGPLVNSVAAIERYYETWGRPWERAALVRARAVAGDLALGRELLAELTPFVFRRQVDPSFGLELAGLLQRSREELCRHPERDLKLGPGGIREAEFFVQTLQLVWGGREPRLRVPGTLKALRRLRDHGLVTDREAREIGDAYLFLRRLEHRVQWATGVQTHELPSDPAAAKRLAWSLGYPQADALWADLEKTRARVASRFASLRPTHAGTPTLLTPLQKALTLLAEGDESAAAALLQPLLFPSTPAGGATELLRNLTALAARPDDPLGRTTAERYPDVGPTFLAAILDAADPELAARTLRALFARTSTPAVYVRSLAGDPRAVRRLVTALGASAFVGTAVAHHPELRDAVLLTPAVLDPADIASELREELAAAPDTRDDIEAFVGILRSFKLRTTVNVALADLAEELGPAAVAATLSALADATIAVTLDEAARSLGRDTRGMTVLALGKLGGQELGYGSDLDIIFLYDPPAGADEAEFADVSTRLAQRVMRWVSLPHRAGPGYELDTRLRPSGAQGTLVTSLSTFARYHTACPGSATGKAAPWERQALLRARFVAGDDGLAARVLSVAHRVAYETGAPPLGEIHRLRLRLEEERGRESPGRYDLKFGRGGLVDIEFAVQALQMRHGKDRRVRTPSTRDAIGQLETAGYLSRPLAETFAEGYRFLRRLEQRIRVVHDSPAQRLDEDAEGLFPLARRMGLRDGPYGTAPAALIARYRDITHRVRAAYEQVLTTERYVRAND